MVVHIREAEEEDFYKVYLLLQEFAAFQRTPDKVSITPTQLIADKAFFKCLLAESATGELVGYATYFNAYYSWSGKAIHLDDLYVVPAYRKHGIGKQLLTAVVDKAKAEGSRKVRWQVSRWNENAIAFYRSLGATIDEVEINCDLYL